VRKLIVCNIMSLDGYYTGPGNDVMALPMDGAFDAYGRPPGSLRLVDVRKWDDSDNVLLQYEVGRQGI
jgi:hypothetical protein